MELKIFEDLDRIDFSVRIESITSIPDREVDLLAIKNHHLGLEVGRLRFVQCRIIP